jgi:hypothetical protein
MIPGAEHNKADRLRRTAVSDEAAPDYKWQILKNCSLCGKPKWIDQPGNTCDSCADVKE